MEKVHFFPAKWKGLLIHGLITAGLAGLEISCLYLWLNQVPGLAMVLLFLLSIFLLVSLLYFIYRIWALISSEYVLERNALRIRWGLRYEEIPLGEIEWIRYPQEMPGEIPWTFLPLPGAYLGRKTTIDFESIEFMASDIKTMLFIGTSKAVFGISPADPSEFITSFESILHMGALKTVPWHTMKTADWLSSAWKQKSTRISVFISSASLILLLLFVGFRIQSGGALAVNFSARGEPLATLPIENALILPSVAAFFWLLNITIGIYFFQIPEMRKAADLMWFLNALILFLFLMTGLIIL